MSHPISRPKAKRHTGRFRSRRWRIALLSIAAIFLLGNGTPTSEKILTGATEGFGYGLDLLVLRPLGVGATVVGFGFFLVGGPLSAPSGQFRDAWELLVVSPYQFTFERPLGEYDDL